MIVPCTRCGARAEVLMAYSYDDRVVWFGDLDEPPQPGHGYALCDAHAERLTPPVGWTLTDRRGPVRRLFTSREVA